MLNRAPAVECSAGEGLWYNSVHCLQDQRGENQEICCRVYQIKMPPLTQISPYQYRMTYDLYIAAFAGAGITLLALVSGSVGAYLAVLPQRGTTMVFWLIWLGDAESVGDEASQAFMTDDLCTVALCSTLSADTNIIIMP